MAVPDTTTFNLQNVVTEINPTTDDLVDCFADATANDFDPAYSGAKNELLDFRNYGGGVAVFSRTLGFTGQSTPCQSQITSTTRYIDNNGAPVVGDRWYSDVGGFTPLNGSNQWWYYNGLTTTQHLIGTDGIIDSITTGC